MKYIAPVDLHEYWTHVKEGLEEVKKRSHADWIPEDIYAALQAGHSTLHVNGEGFVVLTPRKDFDGMTLFVWVAYGEGDVFEKYLPELEMMARQINAKRIRFESSRKGWGKRYKYVTSIYEKELP
jgi:hypothetical protein